jgi:hypothetical protein
MIPNRTPSGLRRITAVPSPRIVERLIGGDHVGLVRVVLGDVGGEVGLADGGAERLAHLRTMIAASSLRRSRWSSAARRTIAARSATGTLRQVSNAAAALANAFSTCASVKLS